MLKFFREFVEHKKTVSFDFDDTLYDTFIAVPRWEILDYMHSLSDQGHKIIIVTARQDKDREKVEQFVQKHKLPVCEIYFTNRELKGPILRELGVSKHVDDCPHQLKSAEDYGVTPVNLYLLLNGGW